MSTQFYKLILVSLAYLFLNLISNSCNSNKSGLGEDVGKRDVPKIINIINFIRQCEPRIDWITEDVLYETLVEQIKIMKQYNLKGSLVINGAADIHGTGMLMLALQLGIRLKKEKSWWIHI